MINFIELVKYYKKDAIEIMKIKNDNILIAVNDFSNYLQNKIKIIKIF